MGRNLEKDFVIPMGIDLGQFLGDGVVFAGPEGVHAGQDELLVDSDFA